MLGFEDKNIRMFFPSVFEKIQTKRTASYETVPFIDRLLLKIKLRLPS